MKRRIWTILIPAALAFSCGAFASCGEVELQSNELLIADFETYEELTEMRWLNQFGAAELSDEHVTNGNKSAHVSIMGRLNAAAKPVICIDTKTERVAKYDFTDVDRFTLDVYNDNDYDANVYFQYLTAAENQNKTSSEIKAVVKAKTAETVEFTIDRALSSYFLNLDDVLQLRIAFDPIDAYGQEYRSFYIDNLRCYTTSETYTAASPRGEDEIESADRPEYVAAWSNILPYIYSPSSLTFNSDPAYIKGGNGSFKLTSERTGGNGELYTIGIACINNPIKDFSQYSSLGYWVYNPNEIVIPAWLTGNYYMGELQPHEWKYFEVTQAMLREAQSGNDKAQDTNSLERFGPMFQVPDDKNYSLYIDEMYALKDGLEPVITVEDFVDVYPEKGVSISVPKASVKYADGYTASVYDPNGGLVGENIENFTAEAYGFYEIVYKATARRADENGNYATAEERIKIAVGTMPEFKRLPENVFLSGTDEYSFTPPESENGTVSWKAEVIEAYYPAYALLGTVRKVDTDGYREGVKEGTGSGSVKVYSGTTVRITYTATNEEQGLSATAVQTVLYSADENRLTEKYSDLYTEGKASGKLSIVDGMENFLGESGGLRLQDELGDASGTFTPSQDVYLGASNNNLRFVVYNNGAKPVSFLVNGNGQPTMGDINVVLAPGSYLVFNGVMFGYEAALQGWKIVSQDKYLLPMNFSATSEAAVDLFIGGFTVNNGSFAPSVDVSDFGTVKAGTSLELADYIIIHGMDKVFSYTVSYGTTEDGNFEQVASGDSEGETAYTPNRAGWYLVEYSVEQGNEKVTVSKKFQTEGRDIEFTDIPENAFVAEGEYTIVPPTSEQGEVIWKAELFEIFFAPGNHGNLRSDVTAYGYENGVKTGSGAGTVYVFGNHAVRITYTVIDANDEGNTRSVSRTVINFTDGERLSETYKNFYADATISGDLTLLGEKEFFGDGGYKLASDTDRGAGKYSAVGTFTPAESAKFLGGSNSNLRIVIYNNGTKDITLGGRSFGGNTPTIKPQTGAVLNGIAYGYQAALVGWGIITADGNLNSLEFSATSDAPIDVRIGYFTVNAGSFVPQVSASLQENYTSGAAVDFADGLSVTGGSGFEYVVKTKDGTQVANGTSENHSAVTLTEAGEYEVVYTVKYKVGTEEKSETYTVNFTVSTFTVTLESEAVKQIGLNEEYNIKANLPQMGEGLNITGWTVQRYPVHMLYGNLQAVDMAEGAPDYIVKENERIISFSALQDHAYKVVYTVSNGVSEATVSQWLLPEDGTHVEELYGEVFGAGHYGAEPGTSIEFGTKPAVTDKTIVATGNGSVGFNFKPQVELGTNLTTLKFWIKIESDGGDTAYLNLGKNGNEWGGKNVPTGIWIRANLDLGSILKAWGIVDTNNNFQELGLRVSGTGNLTVYVDLFTVNAGSFVPQVSANVQENYTSGAAVDFADGLSVTGGSGFEYVVKTKDGTQVANGTSENHSAVTLTETGEYEVIYTVKYKVGVEEKSETYTINFTVKSGELVMENIPRDAFVAEGEYTITPPTSEQGEVVWRAEIFEIFCMPGNSGNLRTDISAYGYENGVKTGSGAGTVYVFGNHAVRITYTVIDRNDEGNTRSVYQTVINFTDGERLSATYANYYAQATVSGNLTLLPENEKFFGDGGFKLANDTQDGAGRYSATGTFTPSESTKFLGGSNTNWRFIVYNNGTSDIMFGGKNFGGNSVTIKPQMSAVFNSAAFGYQAALGGWGIIDGNGNLNSLEFSATSDAPIDVHIGYFTVNEGSFASQTASETSENTAATFADADEYEAGYTVKNRETEETEREQY